MVTGKVTVTIEYEVPETSIDSRFESVDAQVEHALRKALSHLFYGVSFTQPKQADLKVQATPTKVSWDKWIMWVDRILEKKFGATSGEMPDWTWHDAYDEGQGPSAAVDAYLKSQRYP